MAIPERLRHYLEQWHERLASPLPANASNKTLDCGVACLEFHRPRFAKVGIVDDEAILHHLDRKCLVSLPEKSPRLNEVETSVLGDIVLAQRCLVQDERATEIFLDRYKKRIDRWAKHTNFDLEGDFSLWTFLTVDRPKSPPRLACYQGCTPLWCYLERCLQHELYYQSSKQAKDAQHLRRHSETLPTTTTSSPLEDVEVVTRVVESVLEQLTREEALLLYWSIDARPREEPTKKDRERTLMKLGHVLQKSDGHLSRKRDKLLQEVPTKLTSQACEREGTTLENLTALLFKSNVSKEAILDVLGKWFREQEAALPTE